MQALQDLGWVEGETVRFVSFDRTDELSVSDIDLFASLSDAYTRAAKSATSTVPIVMMGSADPVGLGFVSSLAQPGGNVTGLSVAVTGLAGKRLDLLKQRVAGMTRVGVLWDASASGPSAATELREMQQAASALRLQVDAVPFRMLGDVRGALGALRESSDALVVLDSVGLRISAGTIAALALNNRLPSSYTWREGPDKGGLMSYAANTDDLPRRAAGYVDKILKGANPAALPVEQPTTFDFVINLRTAQAIGVSLPPSVLAQATEVIQ
jgi:putative ABC transport system substrate-binding protein